MGGVGGGEWVHNCGTITVYVVPSILFLEYSFLMVFDDVAVCPRPPERQWISLQPDRSRNPARKLLIVSNKVIKYYYI